MTTDVIHDEVKRFQSYGSVFEPTFEIYCNSDEFKPMEYNKSASTDSLGACNAVIQQLSEILDAADHDCETSTNINNTAADGSAGQDEVFDEMDVDKEEESQNNERWKTKLRKNWQRRQLRKRAAANGHKSKNSDNRQSIGGSLSRFFGRASNRLSLPNLQNLTIFKGEGADADGSETDGGQRGVDNVGDSEDDDDRDDGLWSDTEFDVEFEEPREENLYANIDDCILSRGRRDITWEAEAEMRLTSDESAPLSDAHLRQHDSHHYSRVNHRQRPGRSHVDAARHRTTDDVEQLRDGGRRHKPPVAARPAKLKTGPAASGNVSQRPLTCPPSTLDLGAIVPPPSSASTCQTPERTTVDQEVPQQTDVDDRPASTGGACQTVDRHQSRTSASSDTEVSSGDSATSGFCSGPSDVIIDKTTVVSVDNSETMTLGRNAKRQKPAVKPKPRMNDDLITMTLNRRPMRPLESLSSSHLTPVCDWPPVPTTSPPVPKPTPRPFSHPANTNIVQMADSPVPVPRPNFRSQNDTGVVSHPDVEDCVLDPSQTVRCEPEACETAESSYVTKPLPPAKIDVISRVFKWRRSHSIDNVTACDSDKPVMNPMPKTTHDNQEGKAASRPRGKSAFMPGLRKLMMHHRVDTHDSKPKDTKRDTAAAEDRETPATKSSAMKVSQSELADVSLAPVATPIIIQLPQLETQPWYFDNTDKYDCEQKVRAVGQDGAFVVRRRQTDSDGSPYALTLAFDGQIYHMLIRRRDNGKFSLGAERPDQHVFNSVMELIGFYANNPIHLTIDKDSGSLLGKVQLTSNPTR